MTPASSTALKILLVDDDDVDRLAVLRALGHVEAPVQVQEATSAEAGLALLREARFTCAIVDVHMPGHRGDWLLRKARSEGLTTPVIMLTGHGDEATAVELMKAGANDYLSKAELSAERLGQSLRHVLRVYAAEAEARRAVEELRRSEQRLKGALEVAALGSFERDFVTGELSCDARCKELFGVAPDDLPNADSMTACIHPDDQLELARLLNDACDPSACGSYEASYRVRLPGSDTERWVKTTAQITVVDGRPVRAIGTVKDITAQRQYEDQHARQLAFEQELIGIVSHDLRNPISAMMLSASSLLLRSQDNPVVQRGLVRIVSSGERATRMVRDLLDFTRARVGGGIPIERAPCNLHEVARSTLDEVLAGFPERALKHEERGDGHGLWDGDRVAQVVANLVGNALTYSPDDTKVLVRTVGTPDEVLLEVHNEGKAIDEELLASLFEPFRRGAVKGGVRSVGLGLYIVSKIVAAHGGEHEVVSRPGDGTTFRVRLPRAVSEDAEQSGKAARRP